MSTLSRREFITSAAVVGGGLSVTAVVAWPEPARAPTDPAPQLSDWSIDDMWGGHPRYAAPIGCGRPRGRPRGQVARAPAEPGSIDVLFYA